MTKTAIVDTLLSSGFRAEIVAEYVPGVTPTPTAPESDPEPPSTAIPVGHVGSGPLLQLKSAPIE